VTTAAPRARPVLCLAALLGALGPAASAAQAKIIDRVVAVVNDEIVTLSELEDHAAPVLAQAEGIGDPVQRAQVRDRQMRAALDEMIGERLVLQEAAKRQITIGAYEVTEYVDRVKQSQGWDDNRLEMYLSGQGLTLKSFRSKVREDLLKKKVVGRVLGDRIRISDRDLEEYYKQKLTSLRTEYEVEAAHILLMVANDADQATQDAIAQQARELLVRARAGEPFEELATRYSDGPSAKQGGRLGTFRRGSLDPAFEDIAFTLEPGQIGGPVKTRFGWHVIQVITRKPLPTPPLETVREQLYRELQQERIEAVMHRWVEDLKKKSFVEVRL
jgi:peptidyl-prolyl cis-trans isomerase SurA